MPAASGAYDTASEAVNDLARRGYTADLAMEPKKNYLICSYPFAELPPDKFRIDEVYRFEGATDPGDEMIVFAISSFEGTIKGVVVNAFGIYASYRSSQIISHLSTRINK